MTALDVTRRETWHGSYYELAVELSRPKDDARLLRALEVVWSDPRLRGPWTEPAGINRKPPVRLSLLGEGFNLYGVLWLMDGVEVGVLTCIVREVGATGSDWLDLSLPTGILEPLGVAYSLDPSADAMLGRLDAIFLEAADRLHAAVPFDFALVGEEASGQMHAADLSREWVEEHGGCLLSPALWEDLAPRASAKQLASGLRWVPFSSPEARPRA
jgi:hypothetical protein